ncbi:MAG: hypothetical protein JKY67_00065 [Pseudomonadales bacterium]|nr:hypothetical protein [Pseudomonadales bacterium]
MAHPQYDIVETRLTNLTALLRTQYDADVPDLAYRLGSPTARIIKPAEEVVQSSKVYQMTTGHSDSSRAGKDLSKDFDAPRRSTAAQVKIRLDHTDPTANDFRRIDAIARLSIFEIKGMNTPEAAVNIAEMVQTDSIESASESMTILLHADKTAKIGAQSGTKKLNDADNLSDASTYATGNNARILVTDNSIGIFSRNMYLDFYTAAGVLVADNIRVTDVNVVDYSIGLEHTDETTTANLNGLANTVVIYRSGEKDAGFLGGFGETFKATIASGDSWFGDLDRSTAANRHLLPIRLNGTGSATQVAKSHMNNMARHIGYKIRDSGQAVPSVALMGIDLSDELREGIGNNALVQQDAVNSGDYTFGEMGLTFQHPVLGQVTILGDAAASNTRMMLLNPGDWRMQYGYTKGIDVVTRGAGDWERMEGTNTHGGGSMFYRREGFMVATPYCKRINRQVVTNNLIGKGASVA